MPESSVLKFKRKQPDAPSGYSVICENISVRGEKAVVIERISCNFSVSGISIIMGPNGAGKSTLLKTIAGLVSAATGYVQLHPEIAGRSAMVFQRPVLLRRSVRANLNHALRIAGVGMKIRRQRVDELLDISGLTGLSRRAARSLSGGEQQRLQMSRALAFEPRLLLMDEPTASLDPKSTFAIESLIRAASDSGVKTIIVTHDIGQARRLAHEVLFLSEGKLIEQGPASELLKGPKTPEALAFLEGRLAI